MTALLSRGTARFALLIGLFLVYYLTYRHTVWLPRPGQAPEAFTIFPVSAVVWHSAGWLLFMALLIALCATSLRPSPPASDLWLRRLTLIAAFVVYSITGLQRLQTGRLPAALEAAGSAVLIAGSVLALTAALAILRWPPPARWLLGLMLGAGVLLRLALIALVQPDAAFADNLPAVQLSLQRLMAGLTPYAIHDFGDHTNPMPYLPLTWLSYLPAHLLRLDIRLTNLVLATLLTLWCWRLLGKLSLPEMTHRGLALGVGLLFVLPERLSNDLYTAWSPFNLLFVVAFGLLMLGRFRRAALSLGASIAAMPVGVFVGPPLLVLALRRRPGREVVVLVAIIAAVAVPPILLFLLWDAEAFRTAFLFGTTGLWGSLAKGESELPLMLWHGWLGGWLLAAQLALVACITLLAGTRLRTMRGLIGLSAILFIGMIITGPHIAHYMTTVVPYLALLQEAARAGDVPGDRALDAP